MNESTNSQLAAPRTRVILGALKVLFVLGSVYVVWAFIDPHPFRFLYLTSLVLAALFLLFRDQLIGLGDWLLFWTFFMIGLTELLTEGVHGAQVLFFVFATFFLAVVKGTRGTLLGLAICSITMMSAAYLFQTGYLELIPGLPGVPVYPSRWFDELLNLVLLGGATGTAISLLMNNLGESLSKSQDLVGQLEDEIDAKDKAVEENKRNLALYQLLADNISDVVFTLTPDFEITYVSPSVAPQRGFSHEEIMQRNLAQDISEETRPLAVETFSRIGREFAEGSPQPYYELEYQVLHKDGHHIWVESRITALRDEDGNLTSLLGVNRDITTRKQAEADRQVLENQFIHMQRIESVGQLAGGIAHDFNNILVAIIGFAQLSLESDLDKTDRENLEGVISAAERAAKLTNQLLAFSRRQIFDLRAVNLNDLINRLSGMLTRLIRQDIVLTIELPDEPCYVKADAGQLEQVIVNLVVNARDAMPDGGELKISLDTVADGKLHIDGVQEQPSGEFVSLRIRDHGPGIPENIIEHIFEPFFSTKSPGMGTGLGLSTVYGIVTQHEGFVTPIVRNDGADFVVYLPRVAGAEAALVDELGEGESPVDGMDTVTILLVEDDKDVRQVTAQILTKAHYQLYIAEDGLAAMEIWNKHRDHIDLILLDMVMPRMNGTEVMTRIRKTDTDVPILLCSGYYDNIELEPALEEHIDLLKKPYELSELLARVKRALERSTGAAEKNPAN